MVHRLVDVQSSSDDAERLLFLRHFVVDYLSHRRVGLHHILRVEALKLQVLVEPLSSHFFQGATSVGEDAERYVVPL